MEKLACQAVSTEVSANPTGSFEAVLALPNCFKLGQAPWLTPGISALWEAKLFLILLHNNLLSIVNTNAMTESHSVTQPRLWWCHYGSLQSPPPGLKQSSQRRGSHHVAQADLELLGSNDAPASAHQSSGTTGMSHTAPSPRQGFRFHHVGQAGLELPTFSDPPISASQSAGIKTNVFAALPLLHPALNLTDNGVSLYRSGWSAVVRSPLTATSASQVEVILLPQPPKWLGLQAPATTLG
ncbi:hypothetical protein AAY473_030535 [Plecturocebus cupreus]